MNNKAQVGVGLLIIVAVIAIVGALFTQIIAQEVGGSVNTIEALNETFETPANGTAGYITNYRAISDITVMNASNGAAVAANQYVLTNNVLHPTTGALTIRIVPDAGATLAGYDWTFNGTAQPLTYISNSGGRSMANIIVVFFALAVAVVVISQTMPDKFLESFGR